MQHSLASQFWKKIPFFLLISPDFEKKFLILAEPTRAVL